MNRNVILVGVVAVAILAGCAAPAATLAPTPGASEANSVASPSPAVPKPKIVMAFSGTTQPDDLVGYHAMELLQSQYGYTVDAQRLSSDATRPAFLSGQIPIVEQNMKNVADFVAAGAKLFCFTVHDYVLNYVPVAFGKLSSPHDLPAKPKVGVSGLTAIDPAIWMVMAKGYGYPTDYDLIQIGGGGGQSARLAALLAGQVDVTMLAAANAIRAEATGKATILHDYSQYNSAAMNDGFCVSQAWFDQTPGADQALLDFTKAVIQSARWFYEEPDQWKAALIKEIPDYPQDQIDAFHSLFASIHQYPANGGLTQAGVDASVQLAIQTGDFPASEAPKTSDWINFTYEQRALAALGPFTFPATPSAQP